MSAASAEQGAAAVASVAGGALGLSGGYVVPLVVTVVVGALSALGIWRRRSGTKGPPSAQEREEALARARPADGVFTIKTLQQFDGSNVLPLYLGCCGKVVNCSSSENISYGEGYGKLWAGRDATFALATLSLQAEDANKLDFKLSEFTDEQRKTLAQWYKHFTTKYPVVGSMKEYEEWDFSEIEQLAKAQTPFGAKAEADAQAIPAMPGATEGAATEAGALPEGAVVLAKGDRVLVTGFKERPELIGAFGTLTEFDAGEGRFRVELEKGLGTELFRPCELAKQYKKKTTAF